MGVTGKLIWKWVLIGDAPVIRGEPVLPTYNECTRLPVCIGRVFDMLMVHWRRIVILEAFFNRMFVKSFQWPCTIGMMIG